jgi:hypothetical protein
MLTLRRDWRDRIIGTPDDAIAQIERLQPNRGFWRPMLTTHEWTD